MGILAVGMMANKRPKSWFKEQPPWWAIAIFGVLLAVVAGLIVWGIFFAEVPQ
jgi:uncharacterized membrane protein